MVRLFEETYYYPDYQNLIQNLINECIVCNQAKTEHRNTSLLLKTRKNAKVEYLDYQLKGQK